MKDMASKRDSREWRMRRKVMNSMGDRVVQKCAFKIHSAEGIRKVMKEQ